MAETDITLASDGGVDLGLHGLTNAVVSNT